MRINKITSGKILEQGLSNVIWVNGLIEDLKTLDNLTLSGDYKKSPEGILNYYKIHKILFQKLLNLFYRTVTKDIKNNSLEYVNDEDTNLKLFNMAVFKGFNVYCSIIDKMFIKKCIEGLIGAKIDLGLLSLCEDQDLKNYTYTKNYISTPEPYLFNMLGSESYVRLIENNDDKIILSLFKAMLCVIINISIGTSSKKDILNQVSEFQSVANNIRSI